LRLHTPEQLKALPAWSEFPLQIEPTRRAEGSPLAVEGLTADIVLHVVLQDSNEINMGDSKQKHKHT